MIETNIRLFRHGTNLFLDVRRVKVDSLRISADLLERVCGSLRYRNRLAAVADTHNDEHHLLVAALRPVQVPSLSGKNWRADLTDVGGTRLTANSVREAGLMARLFERYLLIQLGRTDMWTLGGGRLWYSAEPFKEEAGIAAYRCFTLSVLPIENVGIGVATHVSTAFFTIDPVAYFFDPALPATERERREALFEKYSERQRGHQASLLYKLPHRRSSCSFDKFLPGKTCVDVKPPPINGESYDSLYAYYEQRHPDANVQPNDPVALVSFPGLEGVTPVVANRLYLRVMNTSVPRNLSQVDKLRPHERAQEINGFWQIVGDRLLGINLEPYFWQPPDSKIHLLQFPNLKYGQNKDLAPPADAHKQAYRDHFRTRLPLLKETGCFYVPPTLERRIVFQYPQTLNQTVVDDFSAAIIERLQRWTYKEFQVERRSYTDLSSAITWLNTQNDGLVIFIMDSSAAYYKLSSELETMRIKRVTAHELTQHHNRLEEGRRVELWYSFIDLSTLDVLEQLDCVPWGITPGSLNYAAHIAIDVGAGRRHFAISFFAHNDRLPFWLNGRVYTKPQTDQETIERQLLRDKLVEVGKTLPNQLRPMSSVLILRDGRLSGEEGLAIQEAKNLLIEHSIFASNVNLAIVDFAKQSLKEVRFWERSWDNRLYNPLEGTAIQFDAQNLFLATTGGATLHQGTAIPLILSTIDREINLPNVAHDIFVTAQLNWANPRVAQRLPLVIRWTDQRLNEQMAKEVRGLA